MKNEDLVNLLISLGVLRSKNIIEAFMKVDRKLFVVKEYRKDAYSNKALPSLCNQTISQPSVVALMLEYLKPNKKCKVLEVGSGTGYVLALLSFLCKEVYGVERNKELVEFSKKNLEKLKIKNVKVFWKDGRRGLKKFSPYDRILVSCAVKSLPKALLKQLSDNGILVAPVGKEIQRITIVKKEDGKVKVERKEEVIFVPLITGIE